MKERRMYLTKGGVIFGVMGHTAGVAYLLLIINDVRSLKDNSITSAVMCNQSLSGKWICTRVTKSVAKALSIQADLKIYAAALVAGGRYTFLNCSQVFNSGCKNNQPNLIEIDGFQGDIMLVFMFSVNTFLH